MQKTRRPTRWMILSVAALAVAPWVSAQTTATAQKPVLKPSLENGKIDLRGPRAPMFGSVAETWQTIGSSDFDPDVSGAVYTSTWNPGLAIYDYRRYIVSGFPHLIAWPRLPGGVLVRSVEFDFCDNSASGQNMTFNVYNCGFTGNCDSTPLQTYTSHDGQGCVGVVASMPSYTVNNYNNKLLVDVIFGATNGDNLLGGVSFGYSYQVSPAPATATFTDVPVSDPAFQYIEALVASGITAGCGGGNYCPNNTLTRRQMAVFISKALGLTWDAY